MEYYKKIDKSMFDGVVTIPKEYENYYINWDNEVLGTSRILSLIFKTKNYQGKFRFVNQSSGRKVLQISFDKELIKEFKKRIYSNIFCY